MTLSAVLQLYDELRERLPERDARILAERDLRQRMPGLAENGAAEILADELALRAERRAKLREITP